MKVYIVKSACGQYEDYHEFIEKVFDSKEKAETFAKEFNDAMLITNEKSQKFNKASELYDRIVDQMYKEGFNWGDNNESYDKCEEELIKRFNEQSEISYSEYENLSWLISDDYYPCVIDEFEVE